MGDKRRKSGGSGTRRMKSAFGGERQSRENHWAFRRPPRADAARTIARTIARTEGVQPVAADPLGEPMPLVR